MKNASRIPDSPLCRDALELARELEPDFLLNHSMRTFLLGRLIGAAEEVRVDEELLCVAGVLHDVGLTDRFDGDQRFEVEGADAAVHLCRGHDVAADRADLVWEAIALHTSLGIASRKAAEVAILSRATGADLFGSDLEHVDTADVQAVMAAHPRLGCVRRFFPLIANQIVAKPHKAPPFTLPAEAARAHLPDYHAVSLDDLVATSAFPD